MDAINASFVAAVFNLAVMLIPIKDGLARQPQDIYIFSAWLFTISISIGLGGVQILVIMSDISRFQKYLIHSKNTSKIKIILMKK